MTPPADLDRRTVLRLLGWWAGFGAVPLRSRAAESPAEPARGHGSDEWLRLLPHRRSAVAIGRRFLRLRPSDADSGRLRRLLGLERAATGELSVAGFEAHRERLRALHREDFRRGRVLELGGWTLSLTELRLAALVALSVEAEER